MDHTWVTEDDKKYSDHKCCREIQGIDTFPREITLEMEIFAFLFIEGDS